MSSAVVIVPVMLLIVIAAGLLAAVLAYPYRGRSLPGAVPGSAALDRLLVAIAEWAGIGYHPDADRGDDVSSKLPTLNSSTAPRD
ncbi:hypothetical protein [Mumia zhuanghuii]|uniref:Uncharacterized protein n=2 Tax=Mumia zhuanghuii TaxID=2585211 RepID=A0A5C4MN93_9ACTN|nr:hypothetical protein [Mumia zhuanghuii]TNC45369.1 hypothetical protein FHE65_14810 [Mumia zhuanghuii]